MERNASCFGLIVGSVYYCPAQYYTKSRIAQRGQHSDTAVNSSTKTIRYDAALFLRLDLSTGQGGFSALKFEKKPQKFRNFIAFPSA